MSKFLIENGKIRLPFVTIPSLGETAAKGITDSRKNGEFISIYDLKERTKLNKASIEILKDSGVLSGVQTSNQMSFF